MDPFVPTAALTSLPFAKACEIWLDSRKPYLSAKTHHEYSLNLKTLSAFFGELRLQEIDADLIRAFQRARKLKVGASAINHECGVLMQIRKRIGLPITDYQPLALPKEKVGRVLSDAERERLFRVASSNPNWEVAYCFALISVNTTAGPKEVASLRLKDIDREREQIQIPPHGAKNITRARPIPLNDEAMKGIKLAVARAKKLGSVEPDHHVFPFRRNREGLGNHVFDPTRHQTSFKSAWKKLTKTALLGGLQMYDLRRTAITDLLENPEVSDETVEELAGHRPGSRTKKRYSHIRVAARRKAVDSLVKKKAPVRERKNNPEKKPVISTDTDPRVLELAKVLVKLLKTA